MLQYLSLYLWRDKIIVYDYSLTDIFKINYNNKNTGVK